MSVFGFGFVNLGNQVCIIFGIETGIFKPAILFPVFNSKLQVWFSFSQLLLRNLNLILVLLASQTQTLKQTFTWVQTQNFNPENDYFCFTLTGPLSLGKVPKSINRTIKYKSRAKKRRDSIKAYKNFYLLSCTLNDFCLFWSHLNFFSCWIIWNY